MINKISDILLLVACIVCFLVGIHTIYSELTKVEPIENWCQNKPRGVWMSCYMDSSINLDEHGAYMYQEICYKYSYRNNLKTSSDNDESKYRILGVTCKYDTSFIHKIEKIYIPNK